MLTMEASNTIKQGSMHTLCVPSLWKSKDESLRNMLQAIALSDGSIFITGGVGASAQKYSEVWSPTSNAWVLAPPALSSSIDNGVVRSELPLLRVHTGSADTNSSHLWHVEEQRNFASMIKSLIAGSDPGVEC